ncbi:ATP-binding protein [Neobacillus pocheonensis]|uniref:ATP-binding protein n=1 Tax=Neobacillus pocheonensis TaxID=363869 RepID=UPI003D2C899B
MKLFHSRLTKRFVITVIVVVLFVLTSLYFVTVNVLNASVRSQMENRDELIASTLGKQIELIIQNVTGNMRQVSPIVEIADINNSNSSYKPDVETILAEDSLYLFFEAYQGNKLQFRIPDVQLTNPKDVRSILDRLSWSKTSYISNMIELPDGRKTIAVAYPSLDEEGNSLGAVIAYLNLNILSEHLQKFAIGKEGMNALVDRNGTIIAHTNTQYIGKKIKEKDVLENINKERLEIWNGTLFNDKMVISNRPILLGRMSLLVAEPIEQALTPAIPVTHLLRKGFLLVLMISLFLAVVSSSRIVRPVMSLIKQVQEYRNGKRDKFHPLDTNDELGDLSLLLSEMAKELRDKELSMFYILESIPYGVITTDPEGRIMTFNKGAEELMGTKRDEVVGGDIFHLPIKLETQESVLLKTLKEGKAFQEVESQIIDKQEQMHDVRIYTSRFKGEQDEYIGSLLVIRDVSEIKKLEEYVKQSERLASLGQLTAGIAHEIKNPLSIIQVAAETIKLQMDSNDEENEIIIELTDDILVSSDRMNKLLTDFLKLTKGDTRNETVPIDLIPLINELLNLLRNKFNDYNVKVYTDYPMSNAIVIGDKHKLSQMLLNLLLNSLQSMKNGGIISITIKDEIEFWHISVSDSGEGIPPDQIKWIFNPFYSTKKDGTGLGLSIVHEIIMQHDGKIWAESEINRGTTIHFQLPKGG